MSDDDLIDDRTEQRGYVRHDFEPFNSSWVMPRCKVCCGFEDHHLHQPGDADPTAPGSDEYEEWTEEEWRQFVSDAMLADDVPDWPAEALLAIAERVRRIHALQDENDRLLGVLGALVERVGGEASVSDATIEYLGKFHDIEQTRDDDQGQTRFRLVEKRAPERAERQQP